jgi:hypothetical protein
VPSIRAYRYSFIGGAAGGADHWCRLGPLGGGLGLAVAISTPATHTANRLLPLLPPIPAPQDEYLEDNFMLIYRKGLFIYVSSRIPDLHFISS